MSGRRFVQRLLWLLAIIAGVVALDQWVKLIMVEWIGPDADSHRYEVMGALVAFEYLENRGAAFGMFAKGTTVLAVISVIIIVVAFAMMMRWASNDFLLATGVALILGGAIGNAIDRFARGYVVDYIAIGRFWKFNLADSAVTIGVILTFTLLWRAENMSTQHNSVQESKL